MPVNLLRPLPTPSSSRFSAMGTRSGPRREINFRRGADQRRHHDELAHWVDPCLSTCCGLCQRLRALVSQRWVREVGRGEKLIFAGEPTNGAIMMNSPIGLIHACQPAAAFANAFELSF